jgi:SAM-dependent methyltransferase
MLIGTFIILYGAVTTIGWGVARYIIPGNRVAIASKIIDKLSLKGEELILDVGSGRGLYAIEAAKRIKSGRVSAIDVWEPDVLDNNNSHHKFSQPTGNTIQNAKKNALIEQVDGKIEFRNMDATKMKFNDKSFDAVVCGYVLGHLWKYHEKALSEIRRVLKNNGKVVIIDNVRDFTYFLLSTPHMFAWSYLRGRKAKLLSKANWMKIVRNAKLEIMEMSVKKGIIVIMAKKRNKENVLN